MANITPRSISFPGIDDPSWLHSEFGVDANLTGTLNIAAFVEATHFPNGFVPSGTPVGKITATGLYGPYDGAAVDGTEVLAGFVYAPAYVETATDTIAFALYHVGVVVEANLPIAVDAGGKTDVAASLKFV